MTIIRLKGMVCKKLTQHGETAMQSSNMYLAAFLHTIYDYRIFIFILFIFILFYFYFYFWYQVTFIPPLMQSPSKAGH